MINFKSKVFSINIETILSVGQICDNVDCKKLPEYISNEIYGGKNYCIKKDTKVACICLRVEYPEYIYYCGGCIDDLCNYIKINLNQNLRAFK